MDNKTKTSYRRSGSADHCRIKPHHRSDRRFMPLAILLAVIIVAAAAGGFVWTSRRQQRQFLERLKKFDIDPEKGRINEANLRRMYHSGGQHQKDAITLFACRKNVPLTKRTPSSKNVRPVRK